MHGPMPTDCLWFPKPQNIPTNIAAQSEPRFQNCSTCLRNHGPRPQDCHMFTNAKPENKPKHIAAESEPRFQCSSCHRIHGLRAQDCPMFINARNNAQQRNNKKDGCIIQ